MKQNGQIDQLLQIVSSADADTAWDEIEQIVSDMGYDYAGVGVIRGSTGNVSVDLNHASDFFNKSFRTYVERGLLDVDPSAKRMANGAPITFTVDECLSYTGNSREGVAGILDHLRTDGVRAHCTVRIDLADAPGFGFIALGSRSDALQDEAFKNKIDEDLAFLKLASTLFAAKKSLASPSISGRVISDRERAGLTFAAQGYSAKEIAQMQGKSLATIRSQLASVKNRLGARNTTHSVSLALNLGLIRLSSETLVVWTPVHFSKDVQGS